MNYRKYKKQIVYFCVALIFLLLSVLYVVNINFKNVINIILISFTIAYTIKPVQNEISERFKISKSKSALIVILIVIGIITISILVLAPKFIDEIDNITNLIDEISNLIQYISDSLKNKRIPIGDSFYYEINEKGNTLLKGILSNLIENLIYISSNLVSYAICPIIVYYFLSDGKKIFDYIMLMVPVSKRNISKKILKDIDKKLSMYIMSQFLLCLIIGVLTFILLIFIKVKFPLWIAIINAIFNIIPYFGPILGIIPAVISALIDSPIKAIYTVIGLVIIQQIEGNILSPKITGDSVDMHPFVIIILLLIGEKFAGFLGMIIIIPIAAVIKVVYDDINRYLF